MERRSMMRPGVSELRGAAGFCGGQVGEEPEVDLFDQVVAALVEAIDGVLDLGDVGVGGLGVAGFVLFVPEIEVFAVLGGDEGE